MEKRKRVKIRVRIKIGYNMPEKNPNVKPDEW